MQKLAYLGSDKEIEELISLLPKDDKYIKFCHNDLLALNIFMSNNPMNANVKDFKLIDYEYSYYNYAFFDLGNFLNESCFNYEVD